jgi:hypothetical protein
MSRACLLSVLLCALLPLRGLAQVSSPPPMVSAPAAPTQEPGAAPGAGEKESPQDEIIPRQPREPQSAGRRVGRIALGTLGGALGGAVGGIPLFVISFAVGGGIDGNGDQTASLVAAGAGLVGYATGMAFGVWGISSLMGGEGRYLPTLAGTVLGLLVGGGLGAYLFTQVEELLAIPPLVGGPLLGAVIGYEISHSIEWERGAEASTGIAVLPTVSVRPSGGFVAGLVGRF